MARRPDSAPTSPEVPTSRSSRAAKLEGRASVRQPPSRSTFLRRQRARRGRRRPRPRGQCSLTRDGVAVAGSPVAHVSSVRSAVRHEVVNPAAPRTAAARRCGGRACPGARGVHDGSVAWPRLRRSSTCTRARAQRAARRALAGAVANPQSCRQMISRTRSWLGRTDDGRPLLRALRPDRGPAPAAPRGALRLGRLPRARRSRHGRSERRRVAHRGLGARRGQTLRLALAPGAGLGGSRDTSDDQPDRRCGRTSSLGGTRPPDVCARPGRRIHRAMRTQAESELLDELLERLPRP